MTRRFLILSDDIRAMGIHLVANRGTGKSRLLGRFLIPQDIYRGVPTIVIDPIGETINNVISKLCELPAAIQGQIWKRVIYIDMAGRGGSVCPFPLYYQLGNESLYQISQRPLDVIRKADAYLATAPVHGWNPTYLIGTHAGRVLFACGCQISELEYLLAYPWLWESRFAEAEQKYPEVKRSTDFFRRFSKWSSDRRQSRTEALLIKAATFTLDPETLAMFSASTPSIDIGTIIEKGQTVLLDFSGVTDLERRRFMLMWVVSYIMSYLKARGPGFTHKPLSLGIDEFSLLTNFQSTAESTFEQELDELINVYSRSHRLWLTISSQSIGQFSEKIQAALLSLGTQIFGAISDMESAEKIAKWFGEIDPWAVKTVRVVAAGRHSVVTTPIYLPLIEQTFLEAKRLQSLPKFTFLVRPAIAEGTVAKELFCGTIEHFDAGRYVDLALVNKAKALLSKRSGVPVETILAGIAERTPSVPPLPPQSSVAVLKPYEKSRRYLLPKHDEDTDEDLR